MELGKGVNYILKPQSIAVIGVSGDTSKAGLTGATGVMNNLVRFGFKGSIYPINPKYNEIMGYKAYKSLKEVPQPPDLVVVGLANDKVLSILQESIEVGAKGAIVITSGFAEGESIKGKQLQHQLNTIASENNFRIVGPNCLGIVNVHEKIVASTSAGLWVGKLLSGNVGLVSQSGALSSSFITRAQDFGIGFSDIVSAGNEADLQIADYIAYMAQDEQTNVIAAFVEGIKDGKKFIEAAELCYKNKKPLIVFKVGKSERAARSAQAHTGSLTGSEVVQDALFKQKGIIRVSSLDDLYEISNALSINKGKKAGNRLGILTLSGGAGGVIADLAAEYDLFIPDFQPETLRFLRDKLPEFAGVSNPVDPTAEVLRDPKLFGEIASRIEQDVNIDVIIIAISAVPPEGGVNFANSVVSAAKSISKPLVICWFTGEMNKEGLKIIRDNGLAVFTEFEPTVKAIKAMADSQKKVDFFDYNFNDYNFNNKKFSQDIDILEIKGNAMSESQSKRILKNFNIPITKEKVAFSKEEATAIAEEIGFPLVMKIDSPDILHKSDAGCVALGINNADEVLLKYDEIIRNAKNYNCDAIINGILIQEMLPKGRETIVGISQDKVFGPTIMFGLGGIFVEVLKDVTFRVAPFSKYEAIKMIKEIKGYKILEGIRGEKRADIEALAEVLSQISQMAFVLKDHIEELDINPLMVFESGKGVKAADALIIPKMRR